MVRRPAPKDREVRITAAIIAGLVSLSTDKSGGLLSLPEGRPQIKKDTIQSITRCEWTDRHSYCSVPIERHKPAPRQGRHGLGIADCMILNMRSERRRAERKRTVTASMQSCRKRQTFGKSIGGGKMRSAESRRRQATAIGRVRGVCVTRSTAWLIATRRGWHLPMRRYRPVHKIVLRNDKVRAFSVAACVRKLRSVLRWMCCYKWRQYTPRAKWKSSDLGFKLELYHKEPSASFRKFFDIRRRIASASGSSHNW